ncbi:hypothetical protein D3C81_1385920 [compost metagenome]
MDNRGKFSQPAGIYSLIADKRLFVLVPSARFTVCHLEYHGEVGFAKSTGGNIFAWGAVKGNSMFIHWGMG